MLYWPKNGLYLFLQFLRMQFKIDENLPLEIKELLITEGHSAATVLDQKLGGQSDTRIIAVCQKEKRALITLDWDFSDIRTYPPQKYSGIVVLNPPNQTKSTLLALASRIPSLLKQEPLEGRLWIIEPERLRIREETV